jgi:hypothetical protein
VALNVFFGGIMVLLATLKDPSLVTSHCCEQIMESTGSMADEKLLNHLSDI